MACFIVPAAEAVAVTIAHKVEKKKEQKYSLHPESNTDQSISIHSNDQETNQESISRIHEPETFRIPLSRKLKWLASLLWGGSVLLAFEHLWHGEIIPWFPFLSALADTEGTIGMLKEMATVGVGMAVLITVVWAGICFAADSIVRRPDPEKTDALSA